MLACLIMACTLSNLAGGDRVEVMGHHSGCFTDSDYGMVFTGGKNPTVEAWSTTCPKEDRVPRLMHAISKAAVLHSELTALDKKLSEKRDLPYGSSTELNIMYIRQMRDGKVIASERFETRRVEILQEDRPGITFLKLHSRALTPKNQSSLSLGGY